MSDGWAAPLQIRAANAIDADMIQNKQSSFAVYAAAFAFALGLTSPFSAYSGCRDLVQLDPHAFVEFKNIAKAQSPASIFVVEPTHSEIRTIISEVLQLQKQHLVNRIPENEITPSTVENGFLIGETNPADLLNNLLKNHGQLVIACSSHPLVSEEDSAEDSATEEQDDILAGYVILTDLTYFIKTVSDETIGSLNLTVEPQIWAEFIENHSNRYVQQIAVDRDLSRGGIASLLLSACKWISPNGILADTLFWPAPYVNLASYQLFLSNSFEDIGTLLVKEYSVFKAFKTHVVFWQGSKGERSSAGRHYISPFYWDILRTPRHAAKL